MFRIILSLVIFSFDQKPLLVSSQSIPQYLEEAWAETLANSSSVVDLNLIQDVSQNCTEALDLLADAVTNFTRCTLMNARPIRICTNCEKENNDTIEAYKLLTDSTDCRKFYFESDGIGIVNSVYEQGRDLWSESYCQVCHRNIDRARNFFKIAQEVDTCMKSFNQSSANEPGDICEKCVEFFVQMYDIYKKYVQEISTEKSNKGICIDIIDQMNITRHLWIDHKCFPSFDSNIGYPNIVTAVIVGSIPVFFYMLSKSISTIEDIILVRPKRKSLLQSESLTVE